MARIKLPAAIDALSGKLGGISFQLGSTLFQAGVNPRTKAPISKAQLAAQGAWTQMVRTWSSGTTQAQKDSWSTFADANPITDSCGNPVKLSGFAAFTRSNRRIKSVPGSYLLGAPSTFTATSPGTLTLTYTPGASPSITITPATAPASSEAVIIRGLYPSRAGRRSTAKQYITIKTVSAGGSTPWEVAAAYVAKFGTLRPGTTLFFAVHYLEMTSGAVGRTSTGSILIS